MNASAESCKRVGIFYETTEGHTRKVVDVLKEKLEGDGYDVIVKRCKEARAGDLEGVDLVVVGASIHMGKHQKKAFKFIKNNLGAIAERPSAFFTVCLSARRLNPEDESEVEKYERELTDRTGWKPDLVRTFAGAIQYTRYGRIKRSLMEKIEAERGGETDTSKDHVFTDWKEVGEFAEELISMMS